jgi:cytochrome c biogenesis protein CcmG/thiol:disulfide interchange protein DsbE
MTRDGGAATPVERDGDEAAAPRRSRAFLLVPVIAFAGFGLFYYGLIHDAGNRDVPSALIGRTAPHFTLPPLPGLDLPGFSSADLKGQVSIVNVWASWCAPCRVEHPTLMQLAEAKDIRLFGLNYRDKPETARRYLGGLGNPFAAVGFDEGGRVGIDWGVYGQPETFVVSPKGVVTYKFIGPLSPETVRDVLRPEIERAKGL